MERFNVLEYLMKLTKNATNTADKEQPLTKEYKEQEMDKESQEKR